jgi:hypothetical protein
MNEQEEVRSERGTHGKMKNAYKILREVKWQPK